MLYKKIDESSTNTITSALDLFSVQPTDISFTKSYYREYLTLNPVTEFPLHWKIHTGSSFIDLSKCFFLTEFRITNADGTALAADANVGTIQALGSTWIRNLRFSINNRQIHGGNQLTAYKSYLDTILSYGVEAKNSHLSENGYFDYTSNDLATNQGYLKNKAMFALSSRVQFISKIYADFFNQNLLLVNGLELDIEVSPTPQDFVLLQVGAGDYKLEIMSCKLYVRFCDLVDSLSLSLNNQLNTQPATYSLRETQIKNLIITAGRTEFNCHLHSDKLARSIALAMVSVDDFNGNRQTNPFNFQPFDLRELTITAGGQEFPSVSYDLSFDDYRFTRAYHDMLDATGFSFSDRGNNISLDKFARGHTIFVFDLTTSMSNSESFELIRNGSTNLSLKFNQPTPAGGIVLIVYSIFDSLLLIDKNRVVSSDVSL